MSWIVGIGQRLRFIASLNLLKSLTILIPSVFFNTPKAVVINGIVMNIISFIVCIVYCLGIICIVIVFRSVDIFSVLLYVVLFIFELSIFCVWALFLFIWILRFVEYGEDVCGDVVLYLGTNFAFDIILVFWRSLYFWISDVGEVMSVLFLFLIVFWKFCRIYNFFCYYNFHDLQYCCLVKIIYYCR